MWDFINWQILIILTFIPAMFVSFLLIISICFLPFIIKGIADYCRASREERKQKFALVDKLVKKRYNEDDFKHHKECAICMEEFGPDD